MEINDEESGFLQRAAFLADATRVVRVIAQRHCASGAALTWQLIRDIREEALADIGLASRWPAQMIDQLAATSSVSPLDGRVMAEEAVTLCELATPIWTAFEESARTDEKKAPPV